MNMLIIALVLLNIIGGLALEHLGALYNWSWAEPLVGALTSIHLAFYFWRPPLIGDRRIARKSLLLCLLLATGGELILSAVLGLYTYRASLLPVFVPPGHVLLFLVGLTCASRPSLAKRAVWWVPLVAAPVLMWQFIEGHDSLSIFLFILFILCLYWGSEKPLYAIMFVLALLLELYGTALGSWRWAPIVPYLDWPTVNPPLAAGSFYAALDLLVTGLAGNTLISQKKPL